MSTNTYATQACPSKSYKTLPTPAKKILTSRTKFLNLLCQMTTAFVCTGRK